MVDRERFVEDLTTFAWLGNNTRRHCTTLCLKHTLKRQCGETTASQLYASSAAGKDMSQNQEFKSNGLINSSISMGKNNNEITSEEHKESMKLKVHSNRALSYYRVRKVFKGLTFEVFDL